MYIDPYGMHIDAHDERSLSKKKTRFAMEARTTMDTIYLPDLSKLTMLAMSTLVGLVLSIFINACRQLFFRSKTEPPTVFHWIPYIGNAVSYGMDPVGFFEKYREKVN